MVRRIRVRWQKLRPVVEIPNIGDYILGHGDHVMLKKPMLPARGELRLLFLWAFFMSAWAPAQDRPAGVANTNGVTFRVPFTLKLRVDKDHYYEQAFPKIPFVFQNDVYLFSGDDFGIDLEIAGGAVENISYQPDASKAAISLRFEEETLTNGAAMMILVIKNRTDQKLFMDAMMTIPGYQSSQKTTVLPVEPHTSGYESWPHPIVQLLLHNIRLKEEHDSKTSHTTNAIQTTFAETNGLPQSKRAPVLDPELHRLIGQKVTLQGIFNLRGKIDPYIRRDGEPVYLQPKGSYSWGAKYGRMQDKRVTVSGILKFRHFDNAGTNEMIQQPGDYYYFELERARIKLD